MGSLTFDVGEVVYVDAQVLIDSVEQRQPWDTVLNPLWDAYQAGAVEVVTSELSLLEVLVRPYRDDNQTLVRAYGEALSGGLARTVPVVAATLQRAAQRRAHYQALRAPDAIHTATALAVGCRVFLSNDGRLRQIQELPLLLLDDVLADGREQDPET